MPPDDATVTARVVGRGNDGYAITLAPDDNTDPPELLIDAWFAPNEATCLDPDAPNGPELPLKDVADGTIVTMSKSWLTQ